ncbi:MAG: class II aldolase/adducin family protein [Bacteroidetes bacterium]|nr:class II aldolase/adducin family protein [Bacteroidota bacterium]
MLLVEQLIDVCHRVYEKGFVSAFDGNLSVFTPENTILITHSNVCKGAVGLEDILEIDLYGRVISGSGKISTEFKLHQFAYAYRPDVFAVIHTHSTYATAFASSKNEIVNDVFPEVILSLGKIPLCKYATPSTDDLPKSLHEFISEGWAYLLENHGAVTLGTDIYDAYYKMEKLEHTAKIISIARCLGGVNKLPQEKIDELKSISEKVYGIKQY